MVEPEPAAWSNSDEGVRRQGGDGAGILPGEGKL